MGTVPFWDLRKIQYVLVLPLTSTHVSPSVLESEGIIQLCHMGSIILVGHGFTAGGTYLVLNRVLQAVPLPVAVSPLVLISVTST